ncbi:DNA polymerase III subunit beta [Microtetraspora malaysiensis]|uniref:Beta sliding clamp n=1 Tax=Microtetraspora malaysiensis TaxID=161358 RepID=A0ABW6SKI2_9ACTN
MRMNIGRDDLLDAVAWTARALSARPSVPVLSGLLLEAGDGLRLSAYDYDTSRSATASAVVAEPGKVLLSGRVLSEIVKSLPAGIVDLSLNGHEVTIRSGRAEFALPTMHVDDYPTLPALPEPTGTVDAAVLAAGVARVVPATTNDDTVPILTGVRADFGDDTVTLTATDRYRIASTTIPWAATQPGTEAGAMIPARHLGDITKSLRGSATVAISDGLAAISGQGRTTTLRLLDPQFIDYKSRLGTDGYTIWAEADVAPLIEAVKRVALVAERNTPVRLAFTPGEVLVRAGSGDIGRGAETVPADVDGAGIEIAFQPTFLLDGLAGVPGSRARIGMATPSKPALITPDGEEPYRYLVMPLRIS